MKVVYPAGTCSLVATAAAAHDNKKNVHFNSALPVTSSYQGEVCENFAKQYPSVELPKSYFIGWNNKRSDSTHTHILFEYEQNKKNLQREYVVQNNILLHISALAWLTQLPLLLPRFDSSVLVGADSSLLNIDSVSAKLRADINSDFSHCTNMRYRCAYYLLFLCSGE